MKSQLTTLRTEIGVDPGRRGIRWFDTYELLAKQVRFNAVGESYDNTEIRLNASHFFIDNLCVTWIQWIFYGLWRWVKTQ